MYHPRYCNHCGVLNQPNANFCSRCAAALNVAAPSIPLAPQTSYWSSGKIILICCLSVVGVTLFVLLPTLRQSRSSNSSSSSSSTTPKATSIHPEVSLTTTGVRVTNRDSFPYSSPRIMINLSQSGERHLADVGTIAPGQTATIPYLEFTNRDASRFNVYQTKIYTIVVKTQLESEPSYSVSICPKNIGPCVRNDQ